ncbi:uncharacterized protein V3H82_023740, partial [Fundulus diaphanus]
SGDICQQFTREMFEMYQGFSYYKNWDFEVLNLSPAEYGRLFNSNEFYEDRIFLYQLYFQYKKESCHLQKYSFVGCIRDGQEAQYMELVDCFVAWKFTVLRQLYGYGQHFVLDWLKLSVVGEQVLWVLLVDLGSQSHVFYAQEFMKGGKELEDLVSDLLEHSEKEAVMEAVETSICLTGQPAD